MINTQNISKSFQPLIRGDKVAGVELAARLVGEALKPAARWRVRHLYHIMMSTMLMKIGDLMEHEDGNNENLTLQTKNYLVPQISELL